MTIPDARPRMTPQQFIGLRGVLARRAGIRLPDNKQFMLESRLAERLAELGLDDFGQYLTFLTTGPFQVDEFRELYSLLRSNESWFFRNQAQLDVFEHRVLPELIERRERTKRLRIWAAACATGEEAYTLAIIVSRVLGGRLEDWHVEIFGTDLTPQLVQTAREGVYAGSALRMTPDAVRSGFFVETDGRWRIDRDIREMVSFGVLDLRETLVASRHGVWDVVFCRDAMINCDDPSRRRIVTTLSNALADDGMLFIGHAENICDVTEALRPISIPHGYCYEKACRADSSQTAPWVEIPAASRRPARPSWATNPDLPVDLFDAEEADPIECMSAEQGVPECALRPIISGAKSVFSTMFQLPVTVGAPRPRAETETEASISGVVEMSGELNGSISLHFPKSTAEAVVSLFCGHKLDVTSPDFADAIGELVTLVSGGAKSSLSQHAVTMSIPTVGLSGSERTSDARKGWIVPCRTDRGPFSIEFAVRECRGATV